MAPDGSITLNETGLEVAGRIYARHKTLTKLFTLMGVSPETAAEDACKVEHDVSEETFSMISDLWSLTIPDTAADRYFPGRSIFFERRSLQTPKLLI